MNRREALQHIALAAAGLAVLPACKVDNWPVYGNIPLDSEQQKLVSWLAEAVLPVGDTPVITPEERVHFVLTMVNDCHSPEAIGKFNNGIQALQAFVQEAGQSGLHKTEGAEREEALTGLLDGAAGNEALTYLLDQTRGLAMQQFTGSEYFMKNHLNFEFIPGRFKGCVEV